MSIAMRERSRFRGQLARVAQLIPIASLTCVFTGGLFGLVPVSFGQAAGINQAGPTYIHGQTGLDPVPKSGSSESAAKIEQMRRAERERHLATDAAKLVQLSAELKLALDQTPKDQLSLDVMRKAAEIEKLAHDVREWMKMQ